MTDTITEELHLDWPSIEAEIDRIGLEAWTFKDKAIYCGFQYLEHWKIAVGIS